MRITPPLVQIPLENPYQNDLFNRAGFGDSVTSLFRNVHENIVLCIDAPWGEGKTTFGRMWQASLLSEGITTVYYNAYEHDYADEPFISFCAEIVSVIEMEFSRNDNIQALKEEFLSKAKRLGSKMLITGVRTGIKALSLNLVGEKEVKDLIEMGKICSETKADILFSAMGDAIQGYTKSKEALANFKEILSNLGSSIRESQAFPLVIVIDELDRCRPDYALALIERVKHMFSVENISFMILANTDQLEEYVKTLYGKDVDARNYLQKYFTLTSKLPKNIDDIYDSDTNKYFNYLLSFHEINDRKNMLQVPPKLFQFYEFSLREMERAFALLSLYCAQESPKQGNFDEVVVFLTILYIKYPDVFTKLSRGQLTYEDLKKETSISLIGAKDYPNFPFEWFLDMLNFYTTPSDKYESDRERKPIYKKFEVNIFKYGIDRLDVIPTLCAELVKFKR